MITFAQVVRQYEKQCDKKGIPSETVMAFLVELSRKERYNLYMHFDEAMPLELLKDFEQGMSRILNFEPMSHVLGYSWFYGYQMIVNSDVLIPRVETEELCAHILARIDDIFEGSSVLDAVDVGTGSGAIAIVIANEEKRVRMKATDISEQALLTAKRNAENNGANIEFMVGDMLQPLLQCQQKFDILISNPPYIPSQEEMEVSVVNFEPHVALFGGSDGLKFYREIFQSCRSLLKEKSFMAFEMGWNQRDAMTKLVQEILPETTMEIIQDMNGKDRILFVYFNCGKKNRK